MPSTAPVITIYKNGDNHFHGKKLVLNPKHYRNFENFLDKVTQDTRSGVAIRNIHTPNHGTKIMNLDMIRNGATYVAAGTERFRRMEYQKIGESSVSKTSSPVKPVTHSKIVATSRFKKEALAEPLKNRIIFVHRNGDEKSPPTKLLLDKRTLQSMDTVLQYISNKINLTAGAVRSLYSLENGSKVNDLNEISTHMQYVAVGSGKHFTKGKYYSSDVMDVTPRKNLRSDKFISPKHKNKGVKKEDEGEPKPVIKSPENVGGASTNLSSYPESDSIDLNIDVLSAASKEKSGTNLFENVLNETSDIVENTNEIIDSHFELVDNKLDNQTDGLEISGTDDENIPMNTDVISDATENEEVLERPASGSPILNGNEQSTNLEIIDNGTDTPLPKLVSNENHESINVEIADDHSGTPPVQSPDLSAEPINVETVNNDSDIPTTQRPAIYGNEDSITVEIVASHSGTPPGTPHLDGDRVASASNTIVDDEQAPAIVGDELPSELRVADESISTASLSVYNASGYQKETGDQVKDNKETVVEELIDNVPAVEVEEEMETIKEGTAEI